MDINEQWFSFMDIATDLLKQGQKINTYQPNIQIAFEPSFDNHYFLQLTWKDKNVSWYRTTWKKRFDAPKIYDPIQALKYIGVALQPTMLYETGNTDISQIQHILEFIETVTIRPRINKTGMITLDGCVITLTIGVESIKAVYKWHYLPEEWKALETIADMLAELNKILF